MARQRIRPAAGTMGGSAKEDVSSPFLCTPEHPRTSVSQPSTPRRAQKARRFALPPALITEADPGIWDSDHLPAGKIKAESIDGRVSDIAPTPTAAAQASTPVSLSGNESDPDKIIPDDPDQDDHQHDARPADAMATEEETRGDPQACLFVASLSSARTEEQLQESVTAHFSRWGTLRNVKVFKDWQQRPYSFVQFSNVQDAKKALIEAQSTMVDGRHIRIEPARVNRSLIIGKYDMGGADFDPEALGQKMRAFGPIEDLSLLPAPNPEVMGRSAFVKYAYREDAIRAYLHVRGDPQWHVDWANHLARDTRPLDRSSLFVGQLNPQLVGQDDLTRRFARYGEMIECTLVNRQQGATFPRCAFAFVRYVHEDAASRAIAGEDGARWLDRNIRVQYREPREAPSPVVRPITSTPTTAPTPQGVSMMFATPSGNPYLPGTSTAGVPFIHPPAPFYPYAGVPTYVPGSPGVSVAGGVPGRMPMYMEYAGGIPPGAGYWHISPGVYPAAFPPVPTTPPTTLHRPPTSPARITTPPGRHTMTPPPSAGPRTEYVPRTTPLSPVAKASEIPSPVISPSKMDESKVTTTPHSNRGPGGKKGKGHLEGKRLTS